jgi:5-methylthioadenosine/S-adenosylhomocysteine deaminase
MRNRARREGLRRRKAATRSSTATARLATAGIPSAAIVLAALLVSSVTKVSAAGRDLSNEATMLTLAGILVDGTLSVSADGKIASVGPTAPNQGVIAPIKVSGVVLPGFIDLHDHLTWNVQPRWLPSRKFSNRYEWQDAAKHDCVLSNPHYAAMNTVSCEAEIEIKALARRSRSSGRASRLSTDSSARC